MAFGYPDSTTGAGPSASTARLVTSQSIHSSIHPPAIIWPSIYLPSISPSIHTYMHQYMHTSDHLPTDPSFSTSIQRSPIIHPSIYSSSIHPPTTYLSIYPSSIHPFIYPSSIHLSVHPLSVHTPLVPLSIYPACLPAFSCPPLNLCPHFKS